MTERRRPAPVLDLDLPPRPQTAEERRADETQSRLVAAAYERAGRHEREVRSIAGHELVASGDALTAAAKLLAALGQRMRGTVRAGVLDSARSLATAALRTYARAQALSIDVGSHHVDAGASLVAQIAEAAAAPEPARKPPSIEATAPATPAEVKGSGSEGNG